jgi:hypothetical protein
MNKIMLSLQSSYLLQLQVIHGFWILALRSTFVVTKLRFPPCRLIQLARNMNGGLPEMKKSKRMLMALSI